MTEPRTTRLGIVLCLGGASLGAVGLAGWLTASDALIRVMPGQPAMLPNTALSLVLLGIAGALRQPKQPGRLRLSLSALAALVVLVIGLGTLAEYVLNLQTGLDQFFIRAQVGPYPGRPAAPMALALTFLAMAILIFDVRPFRRVRPPEWLILCAGCIGLTALLRQLFGGAALYQLVNTPSIGIAVHSAVSLLAISLGLLLERPDSGVMRLFTSSNPGGVLLRRVAPVAILVPAVFPLIAGHLLGMRDIFDVALVFPALTVVLAVTSLFLVVMTAERLVRAHDALEQTRAQTRDLIQQASDAIFVADLNARFTDVNEAGVRLLGYSRKEIVGKTILDLIHPEDVERLASEKTKMLDGGTVVSEWTLRRKDGSDVPVEVSAKILPDGRWQGITRDISERKRAEAALRLSEAKFSGMVSVSPDAIILVDEAQRIVLFNEGAENIFGRSRVEMIGAALDVLIPERFRAMHRREFEAFAAGPDGARRMGTRGGSIYGVRSNGEEFPAEGAISKLSIGGSIILTVTLRDITARKQIEDEQHLSADVLSVLATALDLDDMLTNLALLIVRDLADLCIIDVVEDDKIRRASVVSRDPSRAWVSEALKRMPADPSEFPLGGTIQEIETPLLVEQVTAPLLRSWGFNGEQFDALQAIEPKSAIVLPLSVHGRLVGKFSLFSSGSSRTYGQRELHLANTIARRTALSLERARLYRAAKRATKARDDVLGIVAHDLRNPLQLITSNATTMRRSGTEPFREMGVEIGNAVKRMSRLIQDLLDVTSMEAGHLSLTPARLPSTEVISDSLETQTLLASEASLELRVAVAPHLPDIWADRDRLLQVFENLIGNAVKFTRPGGQITMGAAVRAGEVVFSVADTGTGIAAGNLPHLFDRFWQVTKSGRRGAGLGLPIVKGIVEAHGGRVWVDSAVGQGSTFFFTIPTAPAATYDRSSPGGPGAAHR